MSLEIPDAVLPDAVGVWLSIAPRFATWGVVEPLYVGGLAILANFAALLQRQVDAGETPQPDVVREFRALCREYLLDPETVAPWLTRS